VGAAGKLVERKQREIVLRAVAPSLEAVATERTEEDFDAFGFGRGWWHASIGVAVL
jgi:hypothetical protein